MTQSFNTGTTSIENMSSLEITDLQSKQVQKTPNRVSLDQIEGSIEAIEYIYPGCKPELTIAVIKFNNGYVQTGQSAPADPDNFNKELGRKYAYEDAIRKVWPLFGFALCESIQQSNLNQPA